MSKYDTEQLTLTPRFVEALQELMLAEIEMMREHEPDMADCWDWGICEVSDLANIGGLSFEFGGNKDRPDKLPENTDVMVIEV